MKTPEGDIEIEFGDALSVEKLDAIKPLPQGMKLVDWVVELEEKILLIEFKDPSAKPKSNDNKDIAALEKAREKFIKDLRDDTLVSQSLTPKARDSYTYLHLMERDKKAIYYVVILGLGNINVDPALLLAGFKDRLLGRIENEANKPWKRRYVADCLVLTEHTWPLAFPEYPLRRISDSQAATIPDYPPLPYPLSRK